MEKMGLIIFLVYDYKKIKSALIQQYILNEVVIKCFKDHKPKQKQ